VAQVSMVLLSGGIGQRMKLNIPKQFLHIAGKPMIVHVLERVDRMDEIGEIIIPTPANFIDTTNEIIRTHRLEKPIKVVPGGQTRQESAYIGLQQCRYDRVLIHEAVRPFVKREEFLALINCDTRNAIYGLDIPFTVLQGEDYITGLLERNRLINIQLPQIFDKALLLDAHCKAAEENRQFTEDASLLYYYMGTPIKVLKGTEYNIKITRPIDRKLAELIYKEYILGEEL
jgi:2-C-methyl-D-erythritol 4-phosphate cytidylyltransferase